MKIVPFIAKLMETEQSRELIELNMPRSRKAARKQKASGEMRTPWTVWG